MISLLLLSLACGVSGESSTPSSLLGPRNYNHHPYEVRQYLEETSVAPTKKGPVLFPNAPPSPRQPLIVTSRPLLESIARSDLNNSIPASSIISNIYKPYLSRVQQYQPFVPSVPYGQNSGVKIYDDYEQQPTLPPIYKAISDYADNNLLEVSRKHQTKPQRPSQDYRQYNDVSSENLGSDNQQQPTLPPIYKAISDYADNNLLEISRKQQTKPQRPAQDYRQYNDVSSENTGDEQNQNYAFSYTVKDHKTGDDFSHSQHSSGSATNGEYRVRLPDGRTQIVSYTADENGYKADVRYDTDIPSNRIDNHNANNHNPVDNFHTYNHKPVNNYNAYNHNTVDNNVAYHNAVDNNKAFTHNQVDNNALTHNDYDYKSREEIPIKEDVNEYYDYSSEYNAENYKLPNKFAIYNPVSTKPFVSTVRPTYDEIKDLFTNSHVTATPIYNFQVTPTPSYQKFNDQTEKVVVIGSNRYTDIRSTISNYQNPTTPFFIPDIPVTSKPILSQNFIDRINKYLTFN